MMGDTCPLGLWHTPCYDEKPLAVSKIQLKLKATDWERERERAGSLLQ